MKLKLSKPTTPQWMFVIGLLGIVLSIFLWYSQLNSSRVIGCLTGGCEVVLSSPYGKIFGVPVAAYGVVYYVGIALLGFFRLMDDRTFIVRLTSWISASTGIIASLYFFYLELYKIHAICSWCKVSTLFTIILLVLAIVEIRKFGGWKGLRREVVDLLNR